MLNKKLISENFSRAAQSYNTAALVQKQAAEKLCRLASPFIQKDSAILDLGCGTGFISENLSQKIFEADLSFAMLKQKSGNFKINCDFEHLPFKGQSFDVLISSFSLQWLEDFEKNFANFSAILKPNGIFAFCIPTSNSLKELKTASVQSGCDFHFNQLPQSAEIKSALKNSGFEEKIYKSEIIKSEFESGLQALKSIKTIGANYQLNRNFISKTQLIQFDNFCLKNFSQRSKKVAISWDLSFFIFQKSHNL